MPKRLTAEVVNFSRFKLERHVQRALRNAWKLSEGRPIHAGHLIEGALVVTARRSKAFSQLASMFGLDVGEPKAEGAPPPDLAALPFVKELADAFAISERFFLDTDETVWGRDYITLALLASDPSLTELAQRAGKTLDSLRDEWFRFVHSSGQHRPPASWERWWRNAGVRMPGQTTTTTTARAAYLFTWNPDRFPFSEMEKKIEDIEATGSAAFRWSTGNRREVSIGDRVFLMRQGTESRGLVGVGEIAGDVEEHPHWDPKEREQGRTALFVEVDWTALSREPFVGRSDVISQTGEQRLWSSQGGGVKIHAELAQKLEEIWPTAWAGHRGGATADLEPRQWIARFNADRGGKDDSLQIDRYVNAFARVMASRNLTPPLSIGLFGDWGSGKTFFMDRLHDKINELQAEESDGGASPYWNNICQIRFNAWHYAETDLWASLVSKIFQELRLKLDGADDKADEFNKLLNRLEIAVELRREADEKLAEAKRKHEDARQALVDAERALRELPAPPEPTDEKLRAILSSSIAEVVPTSPGELADLLDSAAELTGRDDLKAAAKGLRDGNDKIEDVRSLVEGVRPLFSRAGFWWNILSQAKLRRSPWFWGVAAVLVLIPATAVVAYEVFESTGWTQFWLALAETSTALSAALAWIRSRLASAGGVMGQLDSVQASIQGRIEEAKNADRIRHEHKRHDAQVEQKSVEDALELVRGEQARAAEAEREAQRAVAESGSQARLGRFIRERSSTADYEKHLGLIAMIHRDFQRLSDLMRGLQKGPADPDLPTIDRIILYIDDLDRCHPPEKVVRVLEAIHLLLFFPLFVVVVGVDSRWISRSLYKHYDGMLADEALAAGTSGNGNVIERAPADSQDFLEKIFQVPFWLRRMEPAAVQRLVHSLIGEDEIDKTLGRPAPVEGDDGVTPDLSEAEDDSLAATKQITAEAEYRHETIGEPLAAPTQSLSITDMELQFMDEVAPLLQRTPRSVKRFVNIYRLYKAALSTPALERFLGTPAKPGNFRAVQVLLALVTGAPRFAQQVFRYLNECTEKTKRLSNLVAILENGEPSWQTTLDALKHFAKGDNDLEVAKLREVSTLVGRYSVHHMVSRAPGQSTLD